MRKKIIIRVVVIFVCLLMILGQVMIIFAESASSSTGVEFLISVYDDVSDKYIVSNTRYKAPENATVADALIMLKDDGKLKQYLTLSGTLVSLVAKDGTSLVAKEQETQFNVRINGNAIMTNSLDTIIQNGNVIEVLYTTKQDVPKAQPTSSKPVVKPNTRWDNDLAKMMSNGFEWLGRNMNNPISYLITAGIVKKTADIKTITTFEKGITKTKQYSSSPDIAQTALCLSLCGFDASSQKYGQLISRLESFPAVQNYGATAAASILKAFDCNKYEVSATAVNSRKALVDMIVSTQSVDGGFSSEVSGESDIPATAACLTALSNYAEQSEVKTAIDDAVTYLSEQQTDNGGFMNHGVENSETLATVIVALNSVGVDLDDARFNKGELSLINTLLEYKNSDDGFASGLGQKSIPAATEQALLALASVKSGANPFLLDTLVPKDDSVPEQGVQMEQDYANTIVLVGIILAILAIGTCVCLFFTRKRN